MYLKPFIWQSSTEGKTNCDLDKCDILSLQLIQWYFLRDYSQNIPFYYALFFISNNLISNKRAEIVKKIKQKLSNTLRLNVIWELFTFFTHVIIQNYMRYSKKCIKNKCASFNEIMWLIIMKMRLKIKIGFHRYNINRPRPKHGHKYPKYKMSHDGDGYLQHLSSICWINGKVKQHWVDKKRCLKKCL